MTGTRVRGIATVAIALMLAGCGVDVPTGAAALERAEQQHDADALVASLRVIERWHVEHDTGVAARLRPGRARAELADVLAGTGCKLTDELAALWGWRDGEDAPAPFVWYHDLLSVEDAVSAHRWLRFNLPSMRSPSLI